MLNTFPGAANDSAVGPDTVWVDLRDPAPAELQRVT